MSRHVQALAPVVIVSLVVLASPALAGASDIAGDLDRTVGGYTDFAKDAATMFAATASALFWKLAVADFAIAIGLHAWQRSDWSDLILDLMRRVGINSLFYLFLTNYAALASEVIEFLRARGGVNADAAGVYAQGAEILTTINERVEGIGFPGYLSPPVLMMVIASILIIMAFAWLGALMVVALVEAYFVIAAAVLAGALTGAGITRSIGLAAYRAPLASGMKLLAVELLIQLGAKQVDTYQALIAAAPAGDFVRVTLQILGGVLVFVALVQVIPAAMAAAVGGGSVGGNPLAAAFGAAAGAAAGVGRSFAGTVMASTQSAAASMEHQLATTGKTDALRTLGGTAVQFGGAYMRDIGARLAGRAPYGTAGGRMAADIAARRAEASKPAPHEPEPPPPPPVVRGPPDDAAPPTGPTPTPEGPPPETGA